jgi:membrane dipeptidase
MSTGYIYRIRHASPVLSICCRALSKSFRQSIIRLMLAVASAALLASCGVFDRQVEYLAKNRVLQPSLIDCEKTDQSTKCETKKNLLIVDLHADSLMWNRDLRRRSSIGHSDFPRLIAGGVNIQVFGAPTKTPLPTELDDGQVCASTEVFDTSNLVVLMNDTLRFDALSPRGRAYRQAERFRDWIENPKGIDVRPIFGRDDLRVNRHGRRLSIEQELAVMLSLEGIHWIGGDRSSVSAEIIDLATAGYRMLGLTHRFSNNLATASEDCDLLKTDKDGGLTELGRLVVEEIARLGLILDLAHASEQTIEDVTETILMMPVARRPGVFMSHGGIQATCNLARNLSDESIRRIIAVDGIIGVGFWPEALCFEWKKGDSDEARARAVFDSAILAFLSIIAAVDSADRAYWGRFGIRKPDPLKHIALGSDFDGAVKMPADASILSLRFADYLGRFRCDSRFLSKIRDLEKSGKIAAGLSAYCPQGKMPFSGFVNRIIGQNAARGLYAGLRNN